MKIILSPAKTMSSHEEATGTMTQPVYMEQAEEILAWMKELSAEELKAMWKCSDKIVQENVERLQDMDLRTGLTPAILAYEGMVFQHLAPAASDTLSVQYLQEHLCILSALYGTLRAMDGIRPYRLDMNNKATVGNSRDLYEYWGRAIYDAVRDDSGIIIDLASKEYTKCISKYLTEEDRMITVSFVERSGDGEDAKLVTKGTYAKMARGEMVRFMAEKQIEDPERIKGFDRMGYVFREDLSSEMEYVFERIVS